MYYVMLFVLFLLVFYFGEITGLCIQCENCKILRKAKRYVWYVPFIQFYLVLSLIVECIQSRTIKLIIAFVRCGQSGIIVLGCMSNSVESKKVLSYSNNKSRNKSVIFRDTVSNVIQKLEAA